MIWCIWLQPKQKARLFRIDVELMGKEEGMEMKWLLANYFFIENQCCFLTNSQNLKQVKQEVSAKWIIFYRQRRNWKRACVNTHNKVINDLKLTAIPTKNSNSWIQICEQQWYLDTSALIISRIVCTWITTLCHALPMKVTSVIKCVIMKMLALTSSWLIVTRLLLSK